MPKLDKEQFIAAARACIGTPFHPQGRSMAHGLDCAGLVVLAAEAAGMQLHDEQFYSMPPQPQALLDGILKNGLQPEAFITAGCLLLFRIGGLPQHLAIATSSDSMVHAYAPAGRVVETAIGPAWHSRLIGIFSFKE